MSKKIYAIMDARDDYDKAWVTEPIIVENDIQASMAFRDFQRQLLKNNLKVTDLRLYRLADFDNDNEKEPIVCEPMPREIAVNLVQGENDDE